MQSLARTNAATPPVPTPGTTVLLFQAPERGLVMPGVNHVRWVRVDAQ